MREIIITALLFCASIKGGCQDYCGAVRAVLDSIHSINTNVSGISVEPGAFDPHLSDQHATTENFVLPYKDIIFIDNELLTQINFRDWKRRRMADTLTADNTYKYINIEHCFRDTADYDSDTLGSAYVFADHSTFDGTSAHQIVEDENAIEVGISNIFTEKNKYIYIFLQTRIRNGGGSITRYFGVKLKKVKKGDNWIWKIIQVKIWGA